MSTGKPITDIVRSSKEFRGYNNAEKMVAFRFIVLHLNFPSSTDWDHRNKYLSGFEEIGTGELTDSVYHPTIEEADKKFNLIVSINT